LAHFSNWLADKGFIRQDVLIMLVPHFRELAARIADHGPHIRDSSILLTTAEQRLPAVHELAETYGVKIVLMVPPTLRPDHSQEIQQLGDKSGVPVWVLSPPGEFPRELFRDGFHLNAQGSAIFTTRLANEIRSQIGKAPVPENQKQ
jgi:lysophospholipase L1-like esterase